MATLLKPCLCLQISLTTKTHWGDWACCLILKTRALTSRGNYVRHFSPLHLQESGAGMKLLFPRRCCKPWRGQTCFLKKVPLSTPTKRYLKRWSLLSVDRSYLACTHSMVCVSGFFATFKERIQTWGKRSIFAGDGIQPAKKKGADVHTGPFRKFSAFPVSEPCVQNWQRRYVAQALCCVAVVTLLRSTCFVQAGALVPWFILFVAPNHQTKKTPEKNLQRQHLKTSPAGDGL